jgi:hypothetical protein
MARKYWFLGGLALGISLGIGGTYYVEHHLWPKYVRPFFEKKKEQAKDAKKSIDDSVDKLHKLVDNK